MMEPSGGGCLSGWPVLSDDDGERRGASDGDGKLLSDREPFPCALPPPTALPVLVKAENETVEPGDGAGAGS